MTPASQEIFFLPANGCAFLYSDLLSVLVDLLVIMCHAKNHPRPHDVYEIVLTSMRRMGRTCLRTSRRIVACLMHHSPAKLLLLLLNGLKRAKVQIATRVTSRITLFIKQALPKRLTANEPKKQSFFKGPVCKYAHHKTAQNYLLTLLLQLSVLFLSAAVEHGPKLKKKKKKI